MKGSVVGRDFEVKVTVAAKDVVADGVVSLLLVDASGNDLPAWEPGAHIDLVLGDAPTRQYSLCGDPRDRTQYRVGVLRASDSRGGSRFIHDELDVEDTVQVQGPRNNFRLAPAERYLFIAGGIGVTPILPMVAAAERTFATWTLVYGGRHRAAMAFLDELAPYGDRVTVCPEDEIGLLDLETVLGDVLPGTLVYCCGPESLLRAVERRCEGNPAASLHVERFAPKAVAEPVRTDAFEIHLRCSDLTLTVPPGRSILSVVEEAGVHVSWSCREGTCGTCETQVVDGEPDHLDSILTDDERQANDCMMICVSRSRTPRLVLDL